MILVFLGHYFLPVRKLEHLVSQELEIVLPQFIQIFSTPPTLEHGQ